MACDWFYWFIKLYCSLILYQKMDLNNHFSYGIYKGRSLRDVWFGEQGDEIEIFDNYIHDVLKNISIESGDNRPIVPFVNDGFKSANSDEVKEHLNDVRNHAFSPEVEKGKLLFNIRNTGGGYSAIEKFQKILDLIFDGDLSNFQHKFYGTRLRIMEEYRKDVIPKSVCELLNFLPNPNYVIHEIKGGRIGVNQGLLKILKDIPIQYPKYIQFNHFENFSIYQIVHSNYQIEIDEETLNSNHDYYLQKLRRKSRSKRFTDYNPLEGICPACHSSPCMCSDPF